MMNKYAAQFKSRTQKEYRLREVKKTGSGQVMKGAK